MVAKFYSLHPTGKRTKQQNDFFNTRVINYWNRLPNNIKDSNSVDMFKSKLEAYKQFCINDPHTLANANYWELYEILFSKINEQNRTAHVDFLVKNPEIAKRRNFNVS